MKFYFRRNLKHVGVEVASVEIRLSNILTKLPPDLSDTADGWGLVISPDNSDFCLWVVRGNKKYVVEREGRAVTLCNTVPDEWHWTDIAYSGVFPAVAMINGVDTELVI